MRLFHIPLLLLAGLALGKQCVACSKSEELPNQSVACPQITERAAISDSAEKAFLREDFSQLEDVARSYRATKSRTGTAVS
jgi:hypothetical protein